MRPFTASNRQESNLGPSNSEFIILLSYQEKVTTVNINMSERATPLHFRYWKLTLQTYLVPSSDMIAAPFVPNYAKALTLLHFTIMWGIGTNIVPKLHFTSISSESTIAQASLPGWIITISLSKFSKLSILKQCYYPTAFHMKDWEHSDVSQ